MARSGPVPMLCTYRVRGGKEAAFLRLLRRHWPALRRAGLATAEPARVFRARGKRGGQAFVEMFSWAGPTASDAAHASPEVLAVWGPMGDLVDSMEFAEIEPVPMPIAAAAARRPRRRRARAGLSRRGPGR